MLSCHCRQIRRAFTLVELLVVIAIIGLLIALLMPAVQAAREAARRTACQNNLHQFGIALHLHHDIYNVLPHGWTAFDASGVPNPEGEPGWSWASRMLPFVEQSPLANRINYSLPITDPVHNGIRDFEMKLFHCPTDVATHPRFTLSDDAGNPLTVLATSNYVGVFGSMEIEMCEGLGSQQCVSDGVFFHNSEVTFGSIIDGLSNTLLVGERSSLHGFSTWVGAVSGGEEAMARVVGTADHLPNDPGGHFDDFGSFHTNGANFVLCDGSARLFNPTMSHASYQAMATRAQRDVP
ncbi:MAG: DUF1559 domain-containing protein [Planctomycetia bacterium]|nr:DUF1559 domain-containing protein [Planctomycetia bacterium]